MLGKFVKVMVAPGKQEIGVVVGERKGSSDIAFLKADLRCVTHGPGVGQYLGVGEELSVDAKVLIGDDPRGPMTTTGDQQQTGTTTEKEPEPQDGKSEGEKGKEKA